MLMKDQFGRLVFGMVTKAQSVFLSSYGQKRLYVLYARHYDPGIVNFLPTFWKLKRFFKEVFSENSVLMYNKYSRAVSDLERVIVARVL